MSEIARELAHRGVRFAFSILAPNEPSPEHFIGYSYATDVHGLARALQRYAERQIDEIGPLPAGVVFVRQSSGDADPEEFLDFDEDDGELEYE